MFLQERQKKYQYPTVSNSIIAITELEKGSVNKPSSFVDVMGHNIFGVYIPEQPKYPIIRYPLYNKYLPQRSNRTFDRNSYTLDDAPAFSAPLTYEPQEVLRPSVSEKLKETLVPYRPKTIFGRRLCEIRDKIVASGESLLDWDDLEKELANRRGGMWRGDDEKAGLC